MKAKFKFFTLLSVLITTGPGSLLANVPEPDTILYGKVLHRAYGNEHQLTEGTLTWTLKNQNGVEYTFVAQLEDIQGVFSYRMSIPHQALSSGLTVDPSVIPLGVGEQTYEFTSIELDGYPAAILWSEIDFLSLIQNARAATYRIDLVVSFDLLDTDDDGMPDWWEQLYGLDWQTPDGGLLSDADPWTNLEEYLRGTNPLVDDRNPSLQTLSLFAYGESDNGVWLRAVDADSSAEELVYTLQSLPYGGYLHFIPAFAGEPETVLAPGATFTQAQINAGLLAYRHNDPSITETSFRVTVSDGTAVSEPAEVSIDVFPPSPLLALDESTESIPFWWREENVTFEAYWSLRENVISGDLVESALLYLLGKNYGWTLWDQRSDTLPVTLAATGAGSHFILGGAADDVLSGGAEDDILSGGLGQDVLSGGAGLDLFIVGDAGSEIITDFAMAEDILDLTELVAGQSGSLDAYLLAAFDGIDTTIGVDRDGDGSGFTDASIVLENAQLSQDDLHRLWSRGQLLLGNVRGFASITNEGWPTSPLEEGYTTAELILRRNGPADQALTVNLSISGSATNGTDYISIPNSVNFAINQSTTSITVDPLTDSISDYEQLILSLAPGTGYVSGAVSTGQIAIADAKQRFSIVAEDAYAVVGEGTRYFRVYRVGPKDSFVELLLNFSGTAKSGSDYTAINQLVSFSSGQLSKLIGVDALADGALIGETSRTLTIGIRPAFGDEYLLGESSEATMRLLASIEAFESWASESLSVESSSLSSEELQSTTSPRTGLQALLEYALSYGLDLDDGVDGDERAKLVPQLTQEADGMHVEFTRRLNDPSLQYIVECSSDLIEWHSGDQYFEPIELPAAEENAGRVRYRVIDPEGTGQCFIRVRVLINE
ncbi:MAG TPA: Calx-beta domain-containing protein [Opitutales bacterium]|nr:Calx-beta domain-containing protein [Opitutales bacterium]